MGFADCNKVLPPTTFVSLPNDGDSLDLVFVGEPIPREEQYRGQARHRYYFPVVSKDGLQVWGIGSKLYRKLRDDWTAYYRKFFKVIRRGASGSQATVYEFVSIKPPASLTKAIPKHTDKDIKKFLAAVQTFGETGDGDDNIPF